MRIKVTKLEVPFELDKEMSYGFVSRTELVKQLRQFYLHCRISRYSDIVIEDEKGRETCKYLNSGYYKDNNRSVWLDENQIIDIQPRGFMQDVGTWMLENLIGWGWVASALTAICVMLWSMYSPGVHGWFGLLLGIGCPAYVLASSVFMVSEFDDFIANVEYDVHRLFRIE